MARAVVWQQACAAFKRWPTLVVYAQTGDVPTEIIPGKHYSADCSGQEELVAGRVWTGGTTAAAIQSLLATAKLNGLEPLAWLTDTENYPRGQKVA
ncbi:MAG: transposase domain-containing protein [Moraxellaceae bacterium]|nr:transposase domain-containing protein [Moraxellaceae bacterium]